MRRILVIAAVTGCLLPVAAVAETDDTGETKRTLPGGKEGTVLESVTVEGEDRVGIQFDRPELRVDIDPATASGLSWGNVWSLLDSDALGVIAPFKARSAFDRTTYVARPYIEEFRTGEVARFRPALEGVEKWTLTVADSRGRTVAQFTGKGKPPKEIGWNGRDTKGTPVPPGPTYSYVLEAMDKAGNKRSFVGDGFQIPAYISENNGETALMFPASALTVTDADAGAPMSRTLYEVATRVNQASADAPVRVEVTAATFQQAKSIADQVVAALRTNLLGDPARIAAVTNVEPTAIDGGTIAVRVAGVAR